MADAPGDEPSEYEKDKATLQGFLENFQDEDVDGEPVAKYMELLQEVSNRQRRVVEVELEDVYEHLGEEMAEKIQGNAKRYIELLAEAIDDVMPQPTEDIAEPDVADILMQQRGRATDAGPDPMQAVPPQLKRRYEIRVLPRTKVKAIELRKVLADAIGSLLTVKGIVTRVTEVKPQMQVATYTCEQGGYEVYQDVSTYRQFLPLTTCPVASCCNATGRLHLQTRGCKFGKFQEVKIQEEADSVPTGHVPRMMTVHLSGELTRSCSAGDTITISGVFLPMPHQGFKALKAGLVTDTYLEAMAIEHHKKSFTDFTADDEMQRQVDEAIASDEDMYSKMAQSIAPEIFGHEDVKKALLLQLVGGATRKMSDGMKIRGDINVCLMGDPGVAKSQLLKHVSRVAPRAVYTTGKGSSGVGLTAAVMRDPVTNDLVLEGGALVLADMGICCIDEFDKMEESDRTAIHEVMEQQTVSIAKAGITTTLNARTSVLAAANPAFSRYNTSRSPEENINLPAALLSRFDLLWLILDRPDRTRDIELAKHVTYVHRYSAHPELQFEPLSPKFIRAFVAHVRKLEPSVHPDVASFVVDEYVTMRSEAAKEGGSGFGFTSARTLLAILRLSQALARLRSSDVVSRDDIVEARRMMTLSRSSIDSANDSPDGRQDPVSIVYNIIKEHSARTGKPAVKIEDVKQRVLQRGRTQAELEACLDEYEQLNVWELLSNRTIVRFIADPNETD